MMMGNQLTDKRCKPCEGGVAALSKSEAQQLLKQLQGWELNSSATAISKTFTFKNYFRTMSFVNAIAWIANQENHHPDLTVSFDRCVVQYTTHAINGLSENDFICAAKIDAISKI
jgi:4a-hydroxytetrahydrobiopterin dehydratase